MLNSNNFDTYVRTDFTLKPDYYASFRIILQSGIRRIISVALDGEEQHILPSYDNGHFCFDVKDFKLTRCDYMGKPQFPSIDIYAHFGDDSTNKAYVWVEPLPKTETKKKDDEELPISVGLDLNEKYKKQVIQKAIKERYGDGKIGVFYSLFDADDKCVVLSEEDFKKAFKK